MKRLLAIALIALPALAQHDASQVDAVTPGSAISTPLPTTEMRRLKRYDLPELAGARQALGSQLIDGRLPKPLVDFIIHESSVEQRISIFEGGLAVVKMTGASTIRKKVILPADAMKAYVGATNATALRNIEESSLEPPEPDRRALLRVYNADGTYVERTFDPVGVPPAALNQAVAPLRDLLRAISEDRDVTSSVAGYQPRPGDELVADDQKVYRVVRVVGENVVELECLDAPTTIYVAAKDLHLYFIGTRSHE